MEGNNVSLGQIIALERATAMPQDWSFPQDWGIVVWIVILAIPVGLMLATFWSRSRQPGAARLETSRDDEPREPI